MKAKLKLEDGREITVDVSEETLKQIKKPVKKTGYERVEKGKDYYSDENEVCSYLEYRVDIDDERYYMANYYSDENVAKNNARADTLMRKLRRFAVEHRETELNWRKYDSKYYICYWYTENKIKVSPLESFRDFSQIYFDTKETAEAAIEEFKDELIWYFTEYKDSL